MKIADILTLFEYNYWANHRILAVAENVPLAQLVAPTGHSYGSLRGNLVHTLDTEMGWRMLCQHQSITSDLEETDFASLADITQRWNTDEAEMRAYLATLQDDDLTDFVRYTNDEGIKRERLLWHVLWHVVNHGTQHRSEAAAMLTDYGYSPGELDFTAYLAELT